LSSGPGNPADLADHIGLAQALLNAKTPLLGIGLGHQLIGLALGFETYLLPQAQRGPNQPVYDVASGQSLITSQNHAYALQAEQGTHAAPHADYGQVTVTQYSLNDNSVESLELTDLPVVTVQYYPENSALETDEPHTVFDRFATLMATGEQDEGIPDHAKTHRSHIRISHRFRSDCYRPSCRIRLFRKPSHPSAQSGRHSRGD